MTTVDPNILHTYLEILQFIDRIQFVCRWYRVFCIRTSHLFLFKLRRRAWQFVARGGIFRNSWCIYVEIGSSVPKNDFSQKSWANYEALVVQICPVSNWIGRNLWFLKEVDGNLFLEKNWLFVHITCSSILKKWITQVLQHISGRSFTKKTISDTQIMENGFFIQ